MRPFLFLLFLSTGLWAEPRFRADDGNLWHRTDNPALATSDGLAFGFASVPGTDWENQTKNLQLLSPLVSFDYSWKDADSALRVGSALGPWGGLSLGYSSLRVVSADGSASQQDFGLLYRPFNFVSLAATLDDSFNQNRVWGAGLALRPLTLFSPKAGWLTLTADATPAGWNTWGARLSWRGSDLRAWYDVQARSLGFEATLAWGASETSVSADRVGQAFRWSSKTPDLAVFGNQILRIRASGTLAPATRPAALFTPEDGGLPALVALLERAAENPSVKAVAFEGVPGVAGLASAEELRQSLAAVRAAGKKVYIYADSYDDSYGFQGWVSTADRLSLHPAGSVWLTAGGSRRLYLKDFFDKIGVKFVNFAPWETKSANNGLTYSSMPEGERAMLKRFLTDRDALALDALKAGRGDRLKREASELVARGPWMVGKEALELGLVDALESKADFEDFVTRDARGTLIDQLPADVDDSWGPDPFRKTVALVPLAGSIVLGPGQAARSIGSEAAEVLRALRTDPEIRAVLLRVDSPGGAVLPSDALAEEVKKTVAAGKPVVVVMGDLAASGGYYLSAPASRIFARPGTLTGSIGVTAALFTGEKALSLLGVHADGVDLAPSSGFGDWTRNLPDADARKWAAMIEATYERFLDVVAEGRRIEKAKLEPLARGQIYTGREALALGLVDELGGQNEARAWLEKELGGSVKFREFTPGENNPWSGLLGPLASAVVQASDSQTLKLASALDPVLAPWAEAATAVAARGGGPLVWVDVP